MLKSSRVKFWYLNPTWTRSPSGNRNPIRNEIALRCDLDTRGLSRQPTSCRNISLSSNPSRSRSPTGTGVLK